MSPPADPERVAAIEARFRARLSWSLLGCVMLLRWVEPLAASPSIRGVGLALATGAFVYLNLPTWRVVQRARREHVPATLWAALAVSLVIRSVAYGLVLALVW